MNAESTPGGVAREDVILWAHMLHVGMTGNIASGKSNAALFFAELGVHVIDADKVAHDLLTPGHKTYRNVLEAFGNQVLCSNGSIDRRKLGKIIFPDKGKRLLLNSLTHPDVGAEILRRIFDLEQSFPHGIVMVDAALMVETGSYEMYDRLIVVTCDPALQISRLMNRDGLTEDEAKTRISSQMPIAEKIKLADYTIDTSSTLKQTRNQVEAVYKDLLLQELETRLHGDKV
jgi:dephospho-CoA kinase